MEHFALAALMREPAGPASGGWQVVAGAAVILALGESLGYRLKAAALKTAARLKEAALSLRGHAAARRMAEQSRRYAVARAAMAQAQHVAVAASQALEMRWRAPAPWSYDRGTVGKLRLEEPPPLVAAPSEQVLLDAHVRRRMAALVAALRAHNRRLDGAAWDITEYSDAVERLAHIESEATDLAHAIGLLLRGDELRIAE